MKLWPKFKALFRRLKLDAEMSEEMRLHLELQTEQNIAAGMDPDEARYAALRQFGGVEQVKERCREQRSWMWLENGWRDLRLAVRSLRRAPAFSLAVIATLALCIGPNLAILSTLYTLVLKPLPFHESDKLVRVSNVFERLGGVTSRQQSSVAQYRDFKANADLFEGFAIMEEVNSTMGAGDTPDRVAGLRTSADFFSLLGVEPLIGRFFSAEEELMGRDRVLVLTQTFWEYRFNADSDVIGRTIRMGGEPWIVIGVAPRALEVLDGRNRFFKPFGFSRDDEHPLARYAGKKTLLGRLKSGVLLETGLKQLSTIDRSFLADKAPPPMRAFLESAGLRVNVRSLREEMSDSLKAPLWFLQGGALFVLLIGCTNVTTLLLARANAKRPEWAIRHALGARRATLSRQMTLETALLVGAAVLVGLGFGWGLLRAINLYLPAAIQLAAPVTIDLGLLGFVLLGSVGVALLIGFIVFGLAWRTGLQTVETRTASGSRRVRTINSSLVVTQVALALVLLVGAGLLIESFVRVMAIEPGFDAARIVQGRVALPVRYDEPQRRLAVQQRILDAIKEIPGVDKAAIATELGVTPSMSASPFVLRTATAGAGQNRPLVLVNAVSPGFFSTLGIRLDEGRDFTDGDRPQASSAMSQTVMIVDQLFVERYLTGRRAVGEEMVIGAHPPPPEVHWPRIIGVVARANLNGLEARDELPLVYLPFVQRPVFDFSLLLRTERPVADILSEIRSRLHRIDPDIPLYAGGSLQTALDEILTSRRGIMLLVMAYAALALLLAGIGLYGVLAYDVSQRTREIGIRAAVGSTQRQLVTMVLRQGLWKTSVGVWAGLICAIYLSRYMRSFLFEVKPTDPLAYVAVVVVLLIVMLIACWLPARRAAKVDPMVALRCE